MHRGPLIIPNPYRGQCACLTFFSKSMLMHVAKNSCCEAFVGCTLRSQRSGLCGGQKLVVGACRLLRTSCTWPFCWAGRCTPANLQPLCSHRACSCANQRFLGCIWGGNSPWSEFVYGHGGSLSTKRGSKRHRHRPKWTKISKISSVQHADLRCSK